MRRGRAWPALEGLLPPRATHTRVIGDQLFTPKQLEYARKAAKSQRTVIARRMRRYLKASEVNVPSYPCPGPKCLTLTPAGRLCHFCSRTVTE